MVTTKRVKVRGYTRRLPKGGRSGVGSHSRNRARSGPADAEAARDLELYIDNDGDLYRQQGEPIEKNLSKKWKKGVYEHKLAVVLYGYLAETGARKYAKEFAKPEDWSRIFNPATRKIYAERAAEHFEQEAKLGNLHSSVK